MDFIRSLKHLMINHTISQLSAGLKTTFPTEIKIKTAKREKRDRRSAVMHYSPCVVDGDKQTETCVYLLWANRRRRCFSFFGGCDPFIT